MTTDDLKDRVMREMPASQGFAGIIALILQGIIMGVIGHYVQKCINNVDPVNLRNPWIWQKVALRHQIRKQCRQAEDSPEGREAGDQAKNLDGQFGDDLQKSFLSVASSLADHEVTSLRSIYGRQ